MNELPFNRLTLKALAIVALGACFYFYDFVLQVSPSIISDNLMSTFGITATVLGTIIGVYFYTYTLFQIPAGILLDLFDAKKVLTLVIALCAIGSLIFGLATNIYFIALGRLLMGAGSAFAFLGALYLCLRWLPTSLFALFVGLTQMLGSLGAAGGLAPLVFLTNSIGWRNTMIIFSVAGFGLALLVFFFVKDNKPPARADTVRETAREAYNRLKRVLLSPQTWSISLYSMMIWAPIASFAALWGVPFLVASVGLPKMEAGSAIAMIWLGMAVACPLAGSLSEVLGKRCSTLNTLSIIGLISSIIVIYFNQIPLWLLYLGLVGIGVSAAGQSVAFAVIKDNQPTQLMGTANGFNNMAIVIGGALFQPFIGKMLDLTWSGDLSAHGVRIYHAANYHYALTIIPCFYLISLGASVFLIRETHCIPSNRLFSIAPVLGEETCPKS